MQATNTACDQDEVYVIRFIYPLLESGSPLTSHQCSGVRFVGVSDGKVFRLSQRASGFNSSGAAWIIGNEHNLALFPYWTDFVNALKERLTSSLI